MASLRKASTRFNHLLWQKSSKCNNLSLVNGVKHMSSLETLGFIGLGNMGNHMARNLVKKGHKLVVFDVSKDAMKTIQNMEGCENCVQTVNSPADVAAQCKHIITMLPATQHVQEVYTNRGTGIFSAIQENSLLVDSSTIDPAASQEMAAIATEKDSSYVDAPVSGGVNAARDAALTFMVGGAPRSFEMAQKYLSVMGRNVVHCGPVGTGQAAKICNNMLLGISMIGTSEAMNLGKKLGLEPKLLAKILNTSSGRCWSSEVYNPCPGVLDGVPSSNNYQGGFGTALMTKDLGLANNAATVTKSPIPMGSLAHQIYRIMTSSGYAGKDFSSAYKFLQDQEDKS
ncbi:3-hydroxyisobutyrate dehydrogenase, mitochondrial-like isoform X1 [Mytilus californianus]|uniref:3-hydroxyisobutyrate dehydrogenase, mitochondrial-like isoform X1 n=1 Tax=Mytilus californianus TaxID=6549 RepID=UPI002247AC15|nr:3-hydroxyisobutyrate dehydrogenase, mitochondrial-like isoform X1 [Mytilus californianus]